MCQKTKKNWRLDEKWIGERCVVPFDFFFFFPQPSAPVVVSDLTNKMFSGAVVCGGGQ